MRCSLLVIVFPLLILLNGCQKQDLAEVVQNPRNLLITPKNITSRSLYATAFTYMRGENELRWRWHKSPVYHLSPNTAVPMPLGTVARKQDLDYVFGYLGLFTTAHEAESATFELLPDSNKIDLDRLLKLKNETILIGIEKYGISGDTFDYQFVPENQSPHEVPELDFVVENQSGRPLHVCGFIYQRKSDMPVWRYDKTPLLHLASGESGVIDVDTITNPYDRKYMRGYLAVFEDNEQTEAYKSTYQLLKAYQKINIGLLSAIKDRKLILKREKYGILGDMIDFTIKEPRRIKFGQSKNTNESTAETLPQDSPPIGSH